MKQRERLYYYLALFIVGIALLEFGSKNIAYLSRIPYIERRSVDYSNNVYFWGFTGVFTCGLCLSFYSMMTIYNAVSNNPITWKTIREGLKQNEVPKK